MFQKRHYEFLANQLLRCAAQALILNKSVEHRRGIRFTVDYLADSLEVAELSFNRTKFLKACGIEDDNNG